MLLLVLFIFATSRAGSGVVQWRIFEKISNWENPLETVTVVNIQSDFLFASSSLGIRSIRTSWMTRRVEDVSWKSALGKVWETNQRRRREEAPQCALENRMKRVSDMKHCENPKQNICTAILNCAPPGWDDGSKMDQKCVNTVVNIEWVWMGFDFNDILATLTKLVKDITKTVNINKWIRRTRRGDA